MAEEHGFQAPEGHRLCANNCGFFGSLTSSNLCSKCYRDLRMKAEQKALTKAAFEAKTDKTAESPSIPSSASSSSSVAAPLLKLSESVSATVKQADLPAPVVQVSAVVQPNRCLTCRKRVGLTGFKCRCGLTFCGSHRYPEQHGCTFDYKTTGKEAIAKANPVVKAAKLNKI